MYQYCWLMLLANDFFKSNEPLRSNNRMDVRNDNMNHKNVTYDSHI